MRGKNQRREEEVNRFFQVDCYTLLFLVREQEEEVDKKTAKEQKKYHHNNHNNNNNKIENILSRLSSSYCYLVSVMLHYCPRIRGEHIVDPFFASHFCIIILPIMYIAL